MRRPGWRPDRWRILGKLLPEDMRERVFDPALGDLVHAELTSPPVRRAWPFAIRVIGTYLGCFPRAVPRFFFHRGRLTRLGRVSLVAAGIVLVVVAVVASGEGMYAAYTP